MFTDLRSLDLLGEITGGGYADLFPHSITLELSGKQCDGLDLGRLSDVTGAVGYPKDFKAIAEFEALANSEHARADRILSEQLSQD